MEDGYPTEKELKEVEQWPSSDFKGLMSFVRSMWMYVDWGWTEHDGYYKISTAGWSGNEEIIGALKKNRLFWMMCWQSSRRGGHYEFGIPRSLQL